MIFGQKRDHFEGDQGRPQEPLPAQPQWTPPAAEHLPVEEIEIHPDELELQPARLYIKWYIHYKYALAGGGTPCIGALPNRVIDTGIAGSSLLATILQTKYSDVCSLYPQNFSQP